MESMTGCEGRGPLFCLKSYAAIFSFNYKHILLWANIFEREKQEIRILLEIPSFTIFKINTKLKH